MNFRILIFFIINFAVLVFSAQAQIAETQIRVDGSTAKEEEPAKNIAEMRTKWRIKAAEKEYQELVAKGEEVAKISAELNKSFGQTKRLNDDDTKKLDRLEKLSKKIRGSLGGNDKDNNDAETEPDKDAEKPKSLDDAIKKLTEKSADLHDELKKNTRYNISVKSVQTTNDLMQLIAFIRQGWRG